MTLGWALAVILTCGAVAVWLLIVVTNEAEPEKRMSPWPTPLVLLLTAVVVLAFTYFHL